MSNTPSIVWFRHDLRLADNPALQAAIHWEGPIIPLFIWSPEEEEMWAYGAASRWWLHHSLQGLLDDLKVFGSRLIIRRADSLSALLDVASETGAGAIFWNRRYEPIALKRDHQVKTWLSSQGLEVQSFNGSLLHEPWTIANKTEQPYQVFTPYWKACLASPEPARPLLMPAEWKRPDRWPKSEFLRDLELEPKIKWAAGFETTWRPGSEGAMARLNQFLSQHFEAYDQNRNRPGQMSTSRLSPHLHFGEISPRQVWHAVRRLAEAGKLPESDWKDHPFITQLGWREFAYHLLFHFPETPEHPLRKEFNNFPWRREPDFLQAWQNGRTGYPIVDAGMRELWSTGWMHNRVRMIAASFLVKDLLIPWQEGSRWFWDTLVDADLANNTLGWQWTAGCGADAAPYFRIFNPVSQGEKFDPEGVYIRRYIPELSNLPNDWIHKPSEAPAEILAAAGVRLGEHYPEPIVRHSLARELALEAFHKIRSEGEAQNLSEPTE